MCSFSWERDDNLMLLERILMNYQFKCPKMELWLKMGEIKRKLINDQTYTVKPRFIVFIGGPEKTMVAGKR
jgi:hypothetical protein